MDTDSEPGEAQQDLTVMGKCELHSRAGNQVTGFPALICNGHLVLGNPSVSLGCVYLCVDALPRHLVVQTQSAESCGSRMKLTAGSRRLSLHAVVSPCSIA